MEGTKQIETLEEIMSTIRWRHQNIGTSHSINAGDYYYTPNVLTINVGDDVSNFSRNYN